MNRYLGNGEGNVCVLTFEVGAYPEKIFMGWRVNIWSTPIRVGESVQIIDTNFLKS